jgi:hypothetical protein
VGLSMGGHNPLGTIPMEQSPEYQSAEVESFPQNNIDFLHLFPRSDLWMAKVRDPMRFS